MNLRSISNVVAYEVFLSYKDKQKLKRKKTRFDSSLEEEILDPPLSETFEEKQLEVKKQQASTVTKTQDKNIPVAEDELDAFCASSNIPPSLLQELLKLTERRCQIARINSLNLLQTAYRFMPLEHTNNGISSFSFHYHLQERLDRSIMKLKGIQAEYLQILQQLKTTKEMFNLKLL